MTDGASTAAEWSSSSWDDDEAAPSSAGPRSPEKRTDIRDWLAAVFLRSVKTGERLLEDGRVAEAAVAFANATLLTDRAGAFAAGVRRVYPSYFYRLFERRMTAMGYGHVFAADPATTTTATAAARPQRRGSPADGRRRQPHGRTVGPDDSSSDRDDDDDDGDGRPPAEASRGRRSRDVDDVRPYASPTPSGHDGVSPRGL